MRTVGVRLTADVSQYMTGLKQAGAATKDFTGSLDRAAKGGHLDKVADQAAHFGLVGAVAFGAVVKAAADFDKQMSAVSAATHASSADLAKLRQAALQAGKDTQFSATQAAQGITELSKAGVSTANILGGGLKGALDLAAAGQMQVGEAAETAASAMTQFKLSGAQVPHIADLLAAGAGKAQGSVHDLSMALSQGGLVAAQMGLSIEDTTGTLAAFASAGLMGSDAGTSLKTMFLQLANPSGKAAELMADLGIKTYDASGRFIGVTKLAGVLRDRLSTLTQEQRNAALATIFGSDAIRAASILYEQGAGGIQGWIDKVNDAGYASETASKLTDNLAGDIERLKGSLETLAIQSGSGTNSGLRILAKGLNDLVGSFMEMPPAVGSTVTVLAGVTGVAALGLAGFIKLRKGLASAVEELNAMGPAGERAATGLSRTAAVAGKLAAVFAALEVAGLILDHFGKSATSVDRLTESLQNFATTGKLSSALTDDFGRNLDDFGKVAQSADAASHGFWQGLNDLTSSIPGVHQAVDRLNESIYGLSFNDAKSRMEGLDQAFAAFIATQKDATQAGQIWQQLLLKSNLNTDQLAALLPNAYQGLQKLQAAAHGAAGATQGAATATQNMGNAAKDAADKENPLVIAEKAAAEAAKGQRTALTDLSTALEAQFNPVVALIQAQRDFKKKQDAAAEAVKTHGKNSKEARQASLDLAAAALTLTGKVGALGGSFDGKLSPAMRTALHNAGLTEDQIKDVEGAFKSAKTSGDKFAKNYQAKASVTGVPGVKASLKDLLIMQEALKKGISVSAASSAFRKNAAGFSSGGWTGPGPRHQVAGAVHADEYVVNKPARQNLEAAKPGGLDYMNSTGRWPGYAGGGLVLPFPVTAAGTRVPSRDETIAAVPGRGYKWMEAVVRAAFPGMAVLSDLRPGARTLTGNVSYHALGRAVDFPPSKPLAEWVNAKYFGRTRELITPWNSLNIHNGQRHTYTGAVWNQHNFAGGNAHDHWAMANGGIIREPVWGVGKSGDTYSFGEYGPERVTPMGGGSGTTISVIINVPPTANRADIGREVASVLNAYADKGGRVRLRGTVRP